MSIWPESLCGMRIGTWHGLSCANCCAVLERCWTSLSASPHSLDRSIDNEIVCNGALNCQRETASRVAWSLNVLLHCLISYLIISIFNYVFKYILVFFYMFYFFYLFLNVFYIMCTKLTATANMLRVRGVTIKFANSPPSACSGSIGQNLVWFDDVDISAFHSCVIVDLWQSLSEWHLLLSACVLVCCHQNVGSFN